MELTEILRDHFDNGDKLNHIIDLVENQKILSQLNAKELLYEMIDGMYPSSTPIESIIEERFGDIHNQEAIDYSFLVSQVIADNKSTVDKIIKQAKKGKDKKSKKGGGGPIMHLVGEVMKLTNKQGDPQQIESIIKD